MGSLWAACLLLLTTFRTGSCEETPKIEKNEETPPTSTTTESQGPTSTNPTESQGPTSTNLTEPTPPPHPSCSIKPKWTICKYVFMKWHRGYKWRAYYDPNDDECYYFRGCPNTYTKLFDSDIKCRNACVSKFKPKLKPQDKPQNETQDETQVQPQDKPQNETQDETQVQPQDETQNKPQNEKQDETQVQPQDKTQDKPRRRNLNLKLRLPRKHHGFHGERGRRGKKHLRKSDLCFREPIRAEESCERVVTKRAYFDTRRKRCYYFLDCGYTQKEYWRSVKDCYRDCRGEEVRGAERLHKRSKPRPKHYRDDSSRSFEMKQWNADRSNHADELIFTFT